MASAVPIEFVNGWYSYNGGDFADGYDKRNVPLILIGNEMDIVPIILLIIPRILSFILNNKRRNHAAAG